MARMFLKFLPLFLSFRKSKPLYPHLTLPTHCSWLSLRRKVFFANFFISNSYSFGGGSPKESKYSGSLHFARQQQTQCVPMLPKSSRLMIHGEWRRGFSSLGENMPLMGILRYLHQFVKSKLESGTSLNIIFFYNHPNCR